MNLEQLETVSTDYSMVFPVDDVFCYGEDRDVCESLASSLCPQACKKKTVFLSLAPRTAEIESLGAGKRQISDHRIYDSVTV